LFLRQNIAKFSPANLCGSTQQYIATIGEYYIEVKGKLLFQLTLRRILQLTYVNSLLFVGNIIKMKVPFLK